MQASSRPASQRRACQCLLSATLPRHQLFPQLLNRVHAGLFILFCAGLYFFCRALVVYPGYVALYIAITAGAGAAVLGAASLTGKPGGKGRRRLSFIAGFGLF